MPEHKEKATHVSAKASAEEPFEGAEVPARAAHGEATATRTPKSFRLDRSTIEWISEYREKHDLSSDAHAIEHIFERWHLAEHPSETVSARIRFSHTARKLHFSRTAQIIPEVLDFRIPFDTLSPSSREHLFDQQNPELMLHDLTRVRYIEPEGPLLPPQAYYHYVAMDRYPEEPEDWEQLIQHHLELSLKFETEIKKRLKAEAKELLSRARDILQSGRPVTEALDELVPSFESPRVLERYSPELEELSHRYHGAHLAYLEGLKTAQQEADDKYRRDKEEWIATHGSDFLRKAFNHGYSCDDRYLQERLALEYPGFEIYDDRIGLLVEVTTPSESGLEQAIMLNGRVKRLRIDGWDPEIREKVADSENGPEVIIVPNWLGRHAIVWRRSTFPVTTIRIEGALPQSEALR